jgi:predicted RND superfamily exporter protein
VLRLRQLVAETRAVRHQLGLTGEPVLVHDEMKQSQSDTALASIVSLIVCALISFTARDRTAAQDGPLSGGGTGLHDVLTTAVVGHLNILTVTFVPILIGLAIDFGVHLVTRYEKN